MGSSFAKIHDASYFVVAYEKIIRTKPQFAQFGGMEVVNALDRDNAASPDGSFHHFPSFLEKERDALVVFSVMVFIQS